MPKPKELPSVTRYLAATTKEDFFCCYANPSSASPRFTEKMVVILLSRVSTFSPFWWWSRGYRRSDACLEAFCSEEAVLKAQGGVCFEDARSTRRWVAISPKKLARGADWESRITRIVIVGIGPFQFLSWVNMPVCRPGCWMFSYNLPIQWTCHRWRSITNDAIQSPPWCPYGPSTLLSEGPVLGCGQCKVLRSDWSNILPEPSLHMDRSTPRFVDDLRKWWL